MKLTKEKTIYLLKESGMFTIYDLGKIFDTYDIDWISSQDIEITKGINDWYNLLVNGEKYTTLNFSCEFGKRILKKLK